MPHFLLLQLRLSNKSPLLSLMEAVTLVVHLVGLWVTLVSIILIFSQPELSKPFVLYADGRKGITLGILGQKSGPDLKALPVFLNGWTPPLGAGHLPLGSGNSGPPGPGKPNSYLLRASDALHPTCTLRTYHQSCPSPSRLQALHRTLLGAPMPPSAAAPP